MHKQGKPVKYLEKQAQRMIKCCNELNEIKTTFRDVIL